jgi:hypothetical protein
MTVEALAFAFDDHLPAQRVALHRCGSYISHGPQIRGDAQRLLSHHSGVRRHRRVRNAVLDDVRDLVVRERPAVHAAPEVDAGDEVAVRSVAVSARGLIDAAAVCDVGGGRVLRVERGRARRRENHQDGRPQRFAAPRSWLGAARFIARHAGILAAAELLRHRQPRAHLATSCQ